jgi:hypothetical protein
VNDKLVERLRSHLSTPPPTAELWIAGQAFIVYITDMQLVRNHRREDWDVRVRLNRGGWLTLPEPMEDRT